MCTHYPPLGRHSVEAGISEAEDAAGGAEWGFAEQGFAEALVEGRILEGVAEEGINKNEGLEKIGGKFDEEGGIRPSVLVGFAVGVTEGVTEGVVFTYEHAAETRDGAVVGDANNDGDSKEGQDGESESGGEGEVGDDDDDDEDEKVDDDEADDEAVSEGDAAIVDSDGVIEGGRVVSFAAENAAEGVPDALENAVKTVGVADGIGIVREDDIVEGVIRGGSIAQGLAEKGLAQGMEEWDVRESIKEECIAADSVFDGGGVEEGVALIREQVENCLDKFSHGLLGVTRIIMDMSHCGNAILVACITHTHKN